MVSIDIGHDSCHGGIHGINCIVTRFISLPFNNVAIFKGVFVWLFGVMWSCRFLAIQSLLVVTKCYWALRAGADSCCQCNQGLSRPSQLFPALQCGQELAWELPNEVGWHNILFTNYHPQRQQRIGNLLSIALDSSEVCAHGHCFFSQVQLLVLAEFSVVEKEQNMPGTSKLFELLSVRLYDKLLKDEE